MSGYKFGIISHKFTIRNYAPLLRCFRQAHFSLARRYFMTTPRPRRTRWLILLTGSLLFLVLLPLACRLLQEKSLYSVHTILLRPDGSDPSTFLSLRGFLLLKHFFTALGLAMLVLSLIHICQRISRGRAARGPNRLPVCRSRPRIRAWTKEAARI